MKFGTTLSRAQIIAAANKVFVWVPRFGKTNNDEFSSSNLSYAYGTTNYLIQFAKTADEKLIGYFISGTGNLKDFNMNVLGGGYEEGTFTEGDALSGIWYCTTDESLNSSSIANEAYNKLNTIIRI